MFKNLWNQNYFFYIVSYQAKSDHQESDNAKLFLPQGFNNWPIKPEIRFFSLCCRSIQIFTKIILHFSSSIILTTVLNQNFAKYSFTIVTSN